MDINILDKELNLVDIIDDAQSVIWTKRFCDCGDFEIFIAANEKNLQKVKEGYFLSREDDDTVMVIEKINIKTDVENGNFLTISGRSAESIIERRCMYNFEAWTGGAWSSYEAQIFRFVIDNLCNNQSVIPVQDNTDLGRDIHIISASDKYIYEIFPGNGFVLPHSSILGDFLSTLKITCENYGCGFKFILEKEDGCNKLFLSPIISKDRSINQTKNNSVVFSREYDNLINSDYTFDKTNYKNCAFVFGEGEGTYRKFKRAWRDESNKQTGLELYEVFIDARDIQSDEGKITEAEYKEILKKRGTEKLSELIKTEIFEGEIEPNTNYKYKVDYFLGDIVSIENEYGIMQNVKITEIVECEDEQGKYIIPKFTNAEEMKG